MIPILKNPELRSCGPLSLLFNQCLLSNFQTRNDKIFIIFITWKLPNFQFREIFIFPWLAISNMEIIQFPRCACGNCHISMALYYQISNAWKFSYFHGVDGSSLTRLITRSFGRLLQSPEVQGTKKALQFSAINSNF